MKFRPLRDIIAIKRVKTSNLSAGGIDLSGVAVEKPSEGVVLAAGPGKHFENGDLQEPTVKVGDKVLFGKSTGTEVSIEGEVVIIMREEDIMGIL